MQKCVNVQYLQICLHKKAESVQFFSDGSILHNKESIFFYLMQKASDDKEVCNIHNLFTKRKRSMKMNKLVEKSMFSYAQEAYCAETDESFCRVFLFVNKIGSGRRQFVLCLIGVTADIL